MGGMGVVTCPWQGVRLGAVATGQEGASEAVTLLEGEITTAAAWMRVTGQKCANLPVSEGGR